MKFCEAKNVVLGHYSHSKCVKSARAVKRMPTTAVRNLYSKEYTNED